MNYSPKRVIRQEISEIWLNLVTLCIGENSIFFQKFENGLKSREKSGALFFCQKFRADIFLPNFCAEISGDPQIDDIKIFEVPNFQKCAEKIETLCIFKRPPEGTGLSEMVIFAIIWPTKPSCHQNMKKRSDRNFWRLTRLFSYPRHFHFLRKSDIFWKNRKTPKLPMKKSSKMCWKN